jgi:flagellar biosynthesis protein FlhB
MPDSGQRSEKPTQRRLDRARKEGNFPSSREFVSSVQFLGFVILMTVFAADGLMRMAHLMRTLLARAFSIDLSPASAASLARHVIAPELAPLLACGGVLVAMVVFAQLATTRLGVSLVKLTPDIGRLNPAT